MSEEIEENVEIADGEEPMEDAPLSAQEIFEIHKAEIDAAFEEKGFIRRLIDMLSGLSKPHSSAEFKLAKIELQRLAAPLCAILLPTLGVIILIVITAITGQSKQTIQVDIARAQEDEAELEEEQEQEEIVEQTPPEETVEVTVDTPNVTMTDVSTPAPTPVEPVSVKPATQDSVALIKSPVTMRSMAGSRTPGSIGKFTAGGASYGDAATEGAVLKALRWLKKTQNKDGSWGTAKPGMTGLAILAFLAHGETPASKEFGDTVRRAIEFLISSVYEDKKAKRYRIRGADSTEYATMIATYALCESYGMTKNPNIKGPTMNMLQTIINGQTATGGWDYHLAKTARDDLSLGGFALQAIKAGKMAGLHPNGMEECIKKAVRCMQKRNYRKEGYFTYVPTDKGGKGDRPGLTATGCLCMQLLGYANEPEVANALKYMRKWKPAFDPDKMDMGHPNCLNPQYYCYYATQCKYQSGMGAGASKQDLASWQEWNLAMKRLYTSTIVTLPEKIPGPDGKPRAMGYWPWVKDQFAKAHGATMQTCLTALQLMVYYRYLPTTQIKATQVEKKDDSKDKKAKEIDVEVDI